jgi:hypothetical protein
MVQRGKLARGPTAEEVAMDVLVPVLQKAQQDLAGKLGRVHGKMLVPRVSIDNPTIHMSALKQYKDELVDAGWKGSTRFPLPKYSPDLHRVIEHTHGRAVLAFRKWMYDNPKKHSVAKYKEVFEQLYRGCCSAKSIASDVAGLPQLYAYVADNDGDWAPACMR